MINSLLPVGEYLYNKDEYSFDDAWENLEESYQNKKFIVCFAISQSEDGKYINLDYHNVRGKMFRGYITQNRRLNSEYFIRKTLCVSIFKLNKREKTFIATHIPVEQESKRLLSSLRLGDKISGIISYIGGEGSYAFIDIKEGIMFFVSAKNFFWRPVGCRRLDTCCSIGDRISGTINFLEPVEKPQHDTIGTLTCLNFEENWDLETKNLKIGRVVQGIPEQEVLSPNKYYIPFSQHVYIEFESEENLSNQKSVKIQLTEIDQNDHLVKAVLVKDNEEKIIHNYTEENQENKSINIFEKECKKIKKTGSLFDLEIKATVSPFCVHINEEKEFESTPNESRTFYSIQKGIKAGHINEQHFAILKAINLFVFCTSKQIMAWLYFNGKVSEGFRQDKLNSRLDTMVKLGLVDRIRFRSSEGEGIYRVYFLNKNGDRLLIGYLGNKRTSYQEALLVTPINEIKRCLATNQIILAFQEKFDFLSSFIIRKIIMADDTTPIRVSGMMNFSNGVFLLETRRRYSGWKEDLVEKVKRYSLLFENHQRGVLPIGSQFLLKKPIYLLLICEDLEHAIEIRNLFFGHTMYPLFFFTYDLLIFQKDINFTIFRFEGLEQSPAYYNITELLCYNLYYTEHVRLNNEERNDDESADFLKHLEKGYLIGLEYLQKHNSPLLEKLVAEDLQELYCADEYGNYQAVYPDEEQHYIYLLFLINHKIVPNLTATFHENNTIQIYENANDAVTKETDSVPEPSAPAELELAVERVLQRISEWCMKNMNISQHIDAPFQITKHPLRQTAGVQYGYDVGMNFKYYGKTYHMGFECKNYSNLLKKMSDGKDARIPVVGYAYNLLEFFMYAEENVNNIWVLICPFGNLQNGFYEKLFERWNSIIPFMKIRTFCSSQTDITCEEFLSLDIEAYRSIYQHEAPAMSIEEREQLLQRVFYTIVDQEDWKVNFDNLLSKYPFDIDVYNNHEQMVLKTLQGDNVSELIFEKLGKNQNIFLVGEYGSGKTFMTYYIICESVEHKEVYPYFPLLFKLSDCSMELTYENIEIASKIFLKEGLKRYTDFPIDLSMKRRLRVLIILDGLDEIVSGLGESELKFLLLEQICRDLRAKYGFHSLFIITSREIDFKSCMVHQQKVPFFNKFAKITIGECQKEDAIQKLQDIEKQVGWKQEEKGWSITHNSKLMNIVQKPLYFGFVREFILEQDFMNDYVDEVDVLQEIVRKSVRRYMKKDAGLTEKAVFQQLRDWARAISIQMTEGGSSEISVYKWNLLPGVKNNVICLRKINENEYDVQFYHNAIREYIVADELYQSIINCAIENELLIREIEERLQKLELTPVMIEFFSKIIEKNSQHKEHVIAQIVKMLQSADHPSKQRFGTNLFSMLCHIQNKLENLDLPGIYASNLHFWNCSLKNVNLQNAYMRNLRLFDVDMECIDLRGADLTGLIIGQDDTILDVQHCSWRNGFRIFVLFANKQLVEYQFSERNHLESYDIVYHEKVEKNEYFGFCPLEQNILFYSDSTIFFATNPEKIFSILPDSHLLKVEPNYILLEDNQHVKLIMHDSKYYEFSIISLMKNETNMLFILDQKAYLYVDEGCLFLKQGENNHFITYLNSTFECFVAVRSMDSSKVKIYIKYSNDIQVICYLIDESKIHSSVLRLPKHVDFIRMKAVKEDLLCGISDQSIYLLDLSTVDIKLLQLQINVECKDLILENPDSTDRVKSEVEYEILKKMCKEYHNS